MRQELNTLRFKVLVLTAALVSLLYFQAGAATVPDTGVKKCYNNTDNITCPERGESFYGQDGNFSINQPSYTKLDENGNALPDNATDTELFMVRDEVTGLVWEVKHAKDNTLNYSDPNDADNIYTWYDGATGTPGLDNDTQDFIDDLNAASYGNQENWRLPTTAELMTIINFARIDPSINSYFSFSNTIKKAYWTAATSAKKPANAFQITFTYGATDTLAKSKPSSARAVCGSWIPETKVLIDNGDGTVTDNTTGFIWQKVLSTDNLTWENALAYCNSLDLAGYTDWRLPSIRELQSIIDYGKSPAVDSSYFTNLTAGKTQHRSSTTKSDNVSTAFIVNMSEGVSSYSAKSTLTKVWAMRSEWPGFTVSSCVVAPQPLNPGIEATITCSANGSIVEYR